MPWTWIPSANFFCPNCNFFYNLSPQDYRAVKFVAYCPNCRHHRTDGYNQVDVYEVVCSVCHMRTGVNPADNSARTCSNTYIHAQILGNNPLFPQHYREAA